VGGSACRCGGRRAVGLESASVWPFSAFDGVICSVEVRGSCLLSAMDVLAVEKQVFVPVLLLEFCPADVEDDQILVLVVDRVLAMAEMGSSSFAGKFCPAVSSGTRRVSSYVYAKTQEACLSVFPGPVLAKAGDVL
jgi:hypothetical protein